MLQHDVDQVFIEALRRRDESAWRALHDREFSPLYRFAVGLGASPDIAEDCVSESFARLLKALPRLRFDSPLALRSWLLVVCRNYLRDQLRRPRPAELRETDEATSDDERSVHTRLALEAALATLPATQREVIVLRFVVGLPTSEVAAVSGRGTKAVESLQHRGLETLRRSIALEGLHP